MSSNASAGGDVILTAGDLRRAASEGVITPSNADALLEWARHAHVRYGASGGPSLERRKGLNWVSVAYYSGAMLMISACAWFLGDKWNALGSVGILATTFVYALVAVTLGSWLRGKSFLTAGGLLVTVAVSLVPLITYCIEDLLGLWPGQHPGDYKRFYPWIHGSWIAMELATVAAAAVALRFVYFGFITAPMAFALWFLSMDLAAWLGGGYWNSWDGRQRVSVAVGFATLLVGLGLERTMRKRAAPRSEDYPFWCYLFGLLAFWGGLTSMDSGSEFNRALYALVNVGLVGIAVWRRRATFLLFGALGVQLYAGHLAYDVFGNSFLFPFVIALLGLSVILVTVWAQRTLLGSLGAEIESDPGAAPVAGRGGGSS